jgi:hypothetical protein
LLLFALIAGGCGGSSGSAISGPMCKRAASVGDGGASGCLAANALVECSNGSIDETCLSDTVSCGGSDPGSCKNTCHGNEYALSCGGIGPQAMPANPPAECRAGLATPAGIVFFCCPCL